MPTPSERRARRSIDVEPELRGRIEIAAAARSLSVRQYVEAILLQALDAEAQGEDASRAGGLVDVPGTWAHTGRSSSYRFTACRACAG